MPAEWQTRLCELVDANMPQLVALRRYLHAHPEPSHEEFATSLHIYQQLNDLGLPVQMGPEGRGVIVSNRAPDVDAPRLALRADIDALRIQDEKTVEYASQNEGIMHACGHDAHSTIAFGAIMALDSLRKENLLPAAFNWRVLFQPAEETCRGARELVEAGVLEGVDAIFALHVDPTRETGNIGIRAGVLTASCDDMQITIHGRGGHGARPHESKDPIAAAALLISTLYQFVPRTTDSQDSVVVTIGKISGGETSNVIPERVELAGTMRTLDRSVREQTIEQIQGLARGVEQLTGTTIEVRFEAGIPSVFNDPKLTTVIVQTFEQLLGKEHLENMPRPSMGGEDFSVYLERVPGAMFRLGCANGKAPSPGLHTPTFDIDERCLAIGTKLLASIAIAWSQQAEISGEPRASVANPPQRATGGH